MGPHESFYGIEYGFDLARAVGHGRKSELGSLPLILMATSAAATPNRVRHTSTRCLTTTLLALSDLLPGR